MDDVYDEMTFHPIFMHFTRRALLLLIYLCPAKILSTHNKTSNLGASWPRSKSFYVQIMYNFQLTIAASIAWLEFESV